MIKLSVFRLGLGLLVAGCAGFAEAVAAEPSTQTNASGATTTYFPPANATSSPTPATTGAIPDTKTDTGASASTAVTPALTPTPTPPAATAATPAAEPAPATAVIAPTTTPAQPSASTTAAPALPSYASPAATGASGSAPATAAATPAPPANPVVEAIRNKLADKSIAGRDNAASGDIAALADYYATHGDPVWTKDGAFTDKAKDIIKTLRNADDWGLEPSDFVVPDLASGASATDQGNAEAQLALAALKYARFARGGRLDPISLSNILDMKPPVKDPKVVLSELSSASEPGAYLQGLNPKHKGFEQLRQALLKARGPKQEEEPTDPALLVKLPDGKQLKPGAQDDQIALLRQRLKIPADKSDDDKLYDDKLVAAVKDVQQANGMKANGILSNRVRAALNKEGEPKKADPKRNVDRLIANMERWRWLPENLGSFYVMNNIPEFTSEIWKGSDLVLRQKMIDGQPSWPTPVLAANMQFVIFHPSWGMPDGIKMKELLPRLRASGTGFGFFDQLFGGGGGAQVLQAYKLQAYYNGHPVDADSVNWSSVDIRQYSFTQPPGADNPLGLVKFRFPNSHDVYMHDTPERGLFSETFRALSHGCMRIEEPRKTAEVILAEDKGYSPEKVGELWDSGANVTLDKPIPVYIVYFTARVDDDGHLDSFGDIYGHDDRIMAALRGHPVRYVAREAIEDPGEAAEQAKTPKPSASATPTPAVPDPSPATASSASPTTTGAISDAGSDNLQDAPPAPKKKSKNKQASKHKGDGGSPVGNFVTDALSGAFLN